MGWWQRNANRFILTHEKKSQKKSNLHINICIVSMQNLVLVLKYNACVCYSDQILNWKEKMSLWIDFVIKSLKAFFIYSYSLWDKAFYEI